jgi:hypothetical protein
VERGWRPGGWATRWPVGRPRQGASCRAGPPGRDAVRGCRTWPRNGGKGSHAGSRREETNRSVGGQRVLLTGEGERHNAGLQGESVEGERGWGRGERGEDSPGTAGFVETAGSGCCDGYGEVLGMAIHARGGEESGDWSNMGVGGFSSSVMGVLSEREVRKTHRQAPGARDLHQLCRTKQPTDEAKGYVTAGWVYIKRASVGDDCQIRRGSRSSQAKETVVQRIARDSVRRRLSQTSARQGHIQLDEDDQS